MLNQDLSLILSVNSEPRNNLEKELLTKIENNRNWKNDSNLISELDKYICNSGLVLTGWSYMMCSGPIYSFEEKKTAEISLKYHSLRNMQPKLRGIIYYNDLRK